MRTLSVLALLTLAGTAAGRDSAVKWMKFDEALARAGVSGQPICVFVAVNPNGSSWTSGACEQTERSFGQDVMVKHNSNFYMVRCADKTTSEKVKSSAISTMIFFDGDGKEYLRILVDNQDSVEAAFRKAIETYSRRPISWSTGDSASVIQGAQGDRKKLVALAFVDEKKDSAALLAALEDRWVAKHHERLVFVKAAFDRNSEECRKWGVTSSPTLLLVNPSEENPKKSVVDQMVAKKELSTVHAFLIKAFEKFDRPAKN